MQQIVAVFLLILAAVFLSIGEGSSKRSSSGDPDQILFYGIVPVLVASVLSGLASALCQWASQVSQASTFVTTICILIQLPISFFSLFFPVLIVTAYDRLRNTHHT